ncbi:MAG: tetratricopeptide repeat protein [Verrucomicrobia bacterium]|nr:tetratricopeptide repeat protein [Verrucomicrobiota bacterium]
MTRWSVYVVAIAVCWLLAPQRCPAPLIYTPGEGLRYERVGEPSWRRTRAKDQLEVAQAAFAAKDYGLALRAARHTIHQWRHTDYAAEAQYLMARCYEARGQTEKAFKAYQQIVERYPQLDKFDEITRHQFAIANRHLAGKGFRIWGVVPWFRSMAKTIEMYEQIVKNGRYSDLAPKAQMNIAAAHENKKILWARAPDYAEAARAYELAADRYNDRPVGADALFKAGEAHARQAKTAEYDQSVAGLAIATFSDFSILHPDDSRVPDAQRHIVNLKTEQARGSLRIARFYEKQGRWQGALIYYNEVLLKNPTSAYADEARQRIDAIKHRTAD